MTDDEIKKVERSVSEILDSGRTNPWVFASIALAIVLVAVLIYNGLGGVTGDVVSEEEAGENLVSFINAQGNGEASVISTEKDGSLYRVMVEFKGQEIPVFVTTDGKYLITEPISLDATFSDSGQQQDPVEVPRSDKPVVEAFVMSHCPYGTMIEKGLIPVVELLGDKIDFELKFVYYAMHGETEVNEQTNQYCIQKEQNDKFLDYLICFLEEGDGESCLTEVGIDMIKLDSCVASADTEFSISANLADESSYLSGRFPLYDVHKAENTKYGVGGSPTLVINGQTVSSGRDAASLLSAVCAAFNEAPAECSEQLSSQQPSAGFGFDYSSGSGSTATCG